MMLHMIIGQVPGWLQAWREIELSVKPRLALLQTRRSVRQQRTPSSSSLGGGGVDGHRVRRVRVEVKCNGRRDGGEREGRVK